MPTPSSGTIRFSDLSLEYKNSSTAPINMGQLGYGGNINAKNDCTDDARSDVNNPYHSVVAGLPVNSGPGSNMRMSQFYNRFVYSAPPNESISIPSGEYDQLQLNSYFEIGRDYNPNQNKRSNPLFMHLTNRGTIYSSTTAQYSARIGTETNSIVYFKNDGFIFGMGGAGGNGGNGTAANSGGAGGNGGTAFYSQIYTVVNNAGLIYGGGGGGGGGGSGHQRWNEGPFAGPTNSGGGGGGGGGGASYVSSAGGNGGGRAANFGSPGGGGNPGGISGPGQGGSGGDGGRGGHGGGGGGNGISSGGAGGTEPNNDRNPGSPGASGGNWGNNGGNGGSGGNGTNGGTGGSGGNSVVITSGKIITGTAGLLGNVLIG